MRLIPLRARTCWRRSRNRRRCCEAFDAALGTVVVVSKRRRLFLWEGVRIHLDEVEGLGSFVEFEAVLPDAGDLAGAHAKMPRLRSSWGSRTTRSWRAVTPTC